MTESLELVEELRRLAKLCREAAYRSSALDDEDERYRAARTLRRVADDVSAFHPATLDVARTFADTAAKLLAIWAQLDMDAVHASRATRREPVALLDTAPF